MCRVTGPTRSLQTPGEQLSWEGVHSLRTHQHKSPAWCSSIKDFHDSHQPCLHKEQTSPGRTVSQGTAPIFTASQQTKHPASEAVCRASACCLQRQDTLSTAGLGKCPLKASPQHRHEGNWAHRSADISSSCVEVPVLERSSAPFTLHPVPFPEHQGFFCFVVLTRNLCI